MNIGMVFDLLVKGFGVLVIAGMASLIVRRSSAAKRHAVWLVAILALALLPLLVFYAPKWHVPVQQVPVFGRVMHAVQGVHLPSPVAGYDIPRTPPPAPPPAVFDWALAATVIWSLTTVVLLLRLTLALMAARRVVLRGHTWNPEGHVGPARLVICADLRVPATVGLFRPVILLPDGAKSWSLERLKMALSHEMAHIKRRDWVWQILSEFACAVHALNPLAWLAVRNLRAESERACDDIVLNQGFDAKRYANELLDIATHARRQNVSLATVSMAHKPAVEDRVRSIVNVARRRNALAGRSLAAALVLALLVVVPIAAFHPFAVAQYKKPSPFPPAAGTVIDEKGNPMADVAAYGIVQDRDGDYLGMVSTTTDSKGHYNLSAKGHPNGIIMRVLFVGPGGRLDFTGPEAFDAQFDAGANIRVQFLLPDGRPAANVAVTPSLLLKRRAEEAAQPHSNDKPPTFIMIREDPLLNLAKLTDADGYVSFMIPERTDIQLDTVDPIFAKTGFRDRVAGGTGSVNARAIHLHLSASIEGTVTAGGQPLAGVNVSAQGTTYGPSLDSWGDGFTDSRGHYLLHKLAPSTYNVAIHESTIPAAAWTARAVPDVTVSAGQALKAVDFRLEHGGIVRGTVRLPDGGAAPNEEIGIYGPAHPDTSAWVGLVTTRADGTYEIRLPSGHHRLYPMANVNENKEVDLREGGTSKVDFEIPHLSPGK